MLLLKSVVQKKSRMISVMRASTNISVEFVIAGRANNFIRRLSTPSSRSSEVISGLIKVVVMFPSLYPVVSAHRNGRAHGQFAVCVQPGNCFRTRSPVGYIGAPGIVLLNEVESDHAKLAGAMLVLFIRQPGLVGSRKHFR